MATITREQFIPKYVRMVREGKTCSQIGEQFGLTSKQVSLKASQYRQALKQDAIAAAKAEGLNEVDTENLVASTVALLPTVTKRDRLSGPTKSLMSAMDELLAQCDAEPEDAPPEETEETPE